MTNTPAGWYPDGSPEGGLRYWDGTQWTEHRAPGPAGAAQRQPGQQMSAGQQQSGPPPAVDAAQAQANQAAALERRRKTNARTLKIVGAVVAVFVVIGIIGAALGDSSDSDGDGSDPAAASSTPAASDEPTQAESTEASDEPTKEASAEESDAPAPPPSVRDQLQSAVDDSDADNPTVKPWSGKGSWLVEFNVADNFSNGMIQAGIAIDVFDMAQQISHADVPVKEVAFRGLFPLVDKYGNEKDGQVFFTTLSGSTMDKIQYDNIDITSMDLIQQLAIGHIVVLHPDLQD